MTVRRYQSHRRREDINGRLELLAVARLTHKLEQVCRSGLLVLRYSPQWRCWQPATNRWVSYFRFGYETDVPCYCLAPCMRSSPMSWLHPEKGWRKTRAECCVTSWQRIRQVVKDRIRIISKSDLMHSALWNRLSYMAIKRASVWAKLVFRG